MREGFFMNFWVRGEGKVIDVDEVGGNDILGK